MPLIKEVKPPCQHLMPDVNKYGLGTIYACDQCGSQAKLEDDYRERYWNFNYQLRYSNPNWYQRD